MSPGSLPEDAPGPLRILHLAASERWTGAAEPVTALAVEQQNSGHRVWVGCVPGRSFERKARERGIETLEGLHLNRRLNPLHLFSDFRALRHFCRENLPHIVHCHLLHDHWSAAAALRIFPIIEIDPPRIVRTLHSSVAPRHDPLHRRLHLRYTDALVAVSRNAADLAERTFHLPQGAVFAVPGAVDTDIFQPQADGARLRRELGIPAGAPVAGIVARMRAGRGHRWLLRAIPRVLERVPDAWFILIGRGEMKHWLKRAIGAPEFAGRVRYAGYRKLQMPSPDKATLPQAYAAMDVSLFLGLGSEGSCRAILEAMACGVPVVGANTGAVPEIVDDGRTGLLVRSRDIDDLAEKLAEILGDRARRAEMGAAGRARVLEHFTQTRRARAVDVVYRRCLSSQSSHNRGA